jgi:hypothetical protein
MASYTLHIQYVDRPAETRTFTQAKVTFGRDSGDVVLHDTQVSGKHGEITFDGTTLRYTDVGSTNGSFLLQGQRVANIELTPGIALRLGNSLITVQVIDAPNVAGKGRTVIAGPGMAPGFPARPPGAPGFTPPAAPAFTPAAPAGFTPPGAPAGFAPPAPGAAIPRPGVPAPAPAPGGFAFAPTAQMQSPAMPGGMPAPPAPMAPVPMPAPPAPMAPPQPGAFVPQTVRPPSPMAPPTPAPMEVGPPQPMPMPAPPGSFGEAGPVAHPPSTAQVYDATPVLPAPTGAAGAGAAPAEGDVVGQVKYALQRGLDVFMPVAASATMLIAALYVTVGVLVQLFLMILPLGLAGALAGLLALAQLLAMVIVMPGLYRYILGSYLGQPVELVPTVKAQIPRAADVAVNCFIPMILLGVFAGPVYWVEDKKIGDVIGRNFSLFGKNLVPILLSLLGIGVVVAIVSGIPAWILTKLPFGGLLASIWSNLVISVVVAFFASFSVAMYFDLRRRHEGGDPESEARARLTAALPPAV